MSNPQKTKTTILSLNSSKHKVSLKKNEQKTIIVLIGSKNNVLQNIQVELAGEGAEANILGIIVGKGNNSITLNTLQKHSAPNTISNLLVKGVFYDSSILKYRGLIQIDKKAQNSNAFQQENNLVLSDKTNIDTRPELEIEANEVRCTHAATIGQIDEEQLYYARSRGISKKSAQALIIEGFLGEVIDRIKSEREKRIILRMIRNLLL